MICLWNVPKAHVFECLLGPQLIALDLEVVERWEDEA